MGSFQRTTTIKIQADYGWGQARCRSHS